MHHHRMGETFGISKNNTSVKPKNGMVTSETAALLCSQGRGCLIPPSCGGTVGPEIYCVESLLIVQSKVPLASCVMPINLMRFNVALSMCVLQQNVCILGLL